jgi:hypothetical protein
MILFALPPLTLLYYGTLPENMAKAKPTAAETAAKKAAKKAAPSQPHIPWTAEMVEVLFYYVIFHQNHIITNTKNWTRTQDSFFKQPALLAYVDTHKPKVSEMCSELESVRNIKDKYKKVLIAVRKDVEEGGNQSGKYGDRSQLYKYVEQIIYLKDWV